jgi:hypothetical protein
MKEKIITIFKTIWLFFYNHRNEIFWYFKNLAIGFDQFVNCVFGGYADETMSSRLYRLSVSDSNFAIFGKTMVIILDLVFLWQGKNHCQKSYEWDKAKMDLPESMRKTE